MINIHLDPGSVADYRRFLKIKSLPHYSIKGRVATVADEYADRIDTDLALACTSAKATYQPPAWMFDYQQAVTSTAIARQKYCLFIDCGFGKTAIFLEFARHALEMMRNRRSVLIVSPLMVIDQTIAEGRKFFGDQMSIKQVAAAELPQWLLSGKGIGITNYEAVTPELQRGNLGGLILDEASLLKSAYGKWGTKLIEMGRGLEWKLSATGTPAPNDRIEFANQAVFMDAFPTINSFLARFFVNRGQTSERWVLKPHALRPFYRALSHWSIFMTDPSTYGWTDNAGTIPPIHIHEHDVPMTAEQTRLAFNQTGRLFADNIGGITSRSVLGQIAKGWYKGKRIKTYKPQYIRDLVGSWPDESTLIWCKYNAEQEILSEAFPEAASLTGATPLDDRKAAINAFKAGELKTLISKPKILGFGLNLQKATRQVFSACEDSYESFYQAVKRSNRVGSEYPLNVHLPMTDIERIQMENVLRKADRVHADTVEQEKLFKQEATI